MYPQLISWQGITLWSYPLIICLAFLAAICWMLFLRKNRNPHLEPLWIIEMGIGSLIVGLLGARGLFIIEASLLDHPARGGLVYYGGFIGVLLFLAIFARLRAKKSILEIYAALAPALLLGQGIGRIACLLHGCCWGKICTLPWAIRYSNPLAQAPKGVDLHPTALYESLLCFALFAYAAFKQRQGRLSTQASLRIYLYGYPLGRFVIEFLRADPLRSHHLGLSSSQWISIFAFLSMLLLDLKLAGRHKGGDET